MKPAAFGFTLLLAALPAYADPIPDFMLEKDYAACMGGENPAQDPTRNNYCLCIKNSMKNWDLNAYENLLMQQANDPQQIPAQLQQLAKACIEITLR